MAQDISPIPEPVEELSIDTIKQRAVKGVIVLVGRGFILQVIAAVAQAILWGLLGPYDLGVFAIVQAAVGFLGYFSDIGLAAALVQQKEKPDEKELSTTFFVQEGLVIIAVIILFFLAPGLARSSNLGIQGQILMYALGLSFFLSSLKSIPSILLERQLEFVKFSIPIFIETVVYYVLLVFLAWKGYGITSFTYAVLARSIVGLVVIYVLKPWFPKFTFSFKALKHLLRFGLPYQLNSFIAVFKDQGIIILLGTILGPAAVGVLDTATRMVNLPLRFVMDSVTKVVFPAFSRMQDERQHLTSSVSRTLFFLTLLSFPMVAGFVIASPIIFAVIPNYTKWLIAVPTITILSINTFFAIVSTPLFNLFYAIKKIKITMYLMIMWATLTWILVPLLAAKTGVNGAALGYAIVGISSSVGIYIAHKYVTFSVWNSLGKPLLATIVMGIVLAVVRPFVPVTVVGLGLLIGAGVIAYVASIISLVGATLLQDVKKSFKIIFSK